MILSIFRQKRPPIAEKLHASLVEASRKPVFYASLGVPDTVEGRFEMISLHMFLYMNRVRTTQNPALRELTQEVLDWGFLEFDRAIRDLGVSDTRVPKKMKKLAAHFYGRVQALEPLLSANDVGGLSATLGRIVYSDETAPGAIRLAQYTLSARDHLETLAEESLLQGVISFPEPVA
jgi:cytochrome b pre-mRNA-processing protein 3